MKRAAPTSPSPINVGPRRWEPPTPGSAGACAPSTVGNAPPPAVPQGTQEPANWPIEVLQELCPDFVHAVRSQLDLRPERFGSHNRDAHVERLVNLILAEADQVPCNTPRKLCAQLFEKAGVLHMAAWDEGHPPPPHAPGSTLPDPERAQLLFALTPTRTDGMFNPASSAEPAWRLRPATPEQVGNAVTAVPGLPLPERIARWLTCSDERLCPEAATPAETWLSRQSTSMHTLVRNMARELCILQPKPGDARDRGPEDHQAAAILLSLRLMQLRAWGVTEETATHSHGVTCWSQVRTRFAPPAMVHYIAAPAPATDLRISQSAADGIWNITIASSTHAPIRLPLALLDPEGANHPRRMP